MAFVNFQEVVAKQERFRIVPVEAWGGDIRLNKLNAAETLELIEFNNETGVDDESSESAMVRKAVEICAKTIADGEGVLQYDTDEGRLFLGSDIKVLFDILEDASDLLGLDEAEGAEAAKKNE